MLAARRLQIRYGDRLALDVPNLEISRGETLAVIGPNGSGKSTLLRVLSLLQRPSGGEVEFGGQVVRWGSDLQPLRRRLAVVFQDPLLRDASVFTNVATGLRFRGVPGREVRHRVGLWLERLGIAHLAERPARTLSGGEAQRAALARGLVLDPDVLFLDEPFDGLDAPTRAGVLADLDRLLAETPVTTVLVTHDRGEALLLGDRVAVLLGGMIAQVGVPGDVFGRPASEEIAAFVGVETILPGTVRGHDLGVAIVDLGSQQVEAVGDWPLMTHVLACLRPEDVVIAPAASAAPSSARNRWHGRVVRVTPLAGQVRVELDCGARLVAAITHHSAADLGLRPGLDVVATFKATAVHLLPRA